MSLGFRRFSPAVPELVVALVDLLSERAFNTVAAEQGQGCLGRSR